MRTKDALRAAGKLSQAVADKGQVFTLGLHDRAEVSLGTISFVVRYVRPSALIRVHTLNEADFTYFKITCISLMAAAAVVAAFVLTPRRAAPTADDIFQDQQRVAKFLVKPEKKLEIKKLKLAGVEEGAKAKDEEGKFGKEEAEKPEAAPSKPGTPVVDSSKREKDRQVVGRVGLLGAFKGLKGGASDVFGPGGLGTGINNALGGLKSGAGLGDAQGVGGLGSRGNGSGGGGAALGIGGVGTQGKGRGTGGVRNLGCLGELRRPDGNSPFELRIEPGVLDRGGEQVADREQQRAHRSLDVAARQPVVDGEDSDRTALRHERRSEERGHLQGPREVPVRLVRVLVDVAEDHRPVRRRELGERRAVLRQRNLERADEPADLGRPTDRATTREHRARLVDEQHERPIERQIAHDCPQRPIEQLIEIERRRQDEPELVERDELRHPVLELGP